MRCGLVVALAACGGAPIAPAAPAPQVSACLPGGFYHLARLGGDAVLCVENMGFDVGWGGPKDELPLALACFTLSADGHLAPREAKALPAMAFSYDGPCERGICWAAHPKRVRIAFDPDGVRAALIDRLNVSIYDLATHRVISTFEADIPGDFWLLDKTLYVATAPAGPGARLRAFDLDGTETDLSEGLYHGGIALDGHRLVFDDDALTALAVLDGALAPHRFAARSLAHPCRPPSGMAWQDAPEECKRYIARAYGPYDRALVLPAGDRLIGFAPERREVFTLDATTLAERSRTAVARCPELEPAEPPSDTE